MMYIEKTISLFNWDKLEKALDTLRQPDLAQITCPHCKQRIKLPVIARECDIQAFKELIQLAQQYLEEKDLLSKMLDYICKEAKKIKNEKLQ